MKSPQRHHMVAYMKDGNGYLVSKTKEDLLQRFIKYLEFCFTDNGR